MYILYFATDELLEDVTEIERSEYREWAFEVLSQRYPEYIILIVKNSSDESVCVTDDSDNADQITEFCQNLFEQYPWDE